MTIILPERESTRPFSSSMGSGSMGPTLSSLSQICTGSSSSPASSSSQSLSCGLWPLPAEMSSAVLPPSMDRLLPSVASMAANSAKKKSALRPPDRLSPPPWPCATPPPARKSLPTPPNAVSAPRPPRKILPLVSTPSPLKLRPS